MQHIPSGDVHVDLRATMSFEVDSASNDVYKDTSPFLKVNL